jgi:hypothetical protein
MKTLLNTSMRLRALLVLLLSACGGGGAGAGAETPLAPAQAGLSQAAGSVDESGPGGATEADYTLAEYRPPPDSAIGAPPGAALAAAPAGPLPQAVLRAVAAPAHLYVSPKGSDSNPGTPDLPLRTIARAALRSGPGTTVHVAPGTYGGGFRTNASGTPDARIYYLSTVKWGAKIVPPARSVSNTAWDNRGSYVDIIGFDIDGSDHQSGTLWSHGLYNGGSFDAIRNNRVQHIAEQAACGHGGGAAINVDGYYRGEGSEVIANLVHDIGPAGCSYIQGIYFSTSGSIKNNVVYRVAEAGIHLWHDAHDVVITNNTVTDSNTGIIVGGGDFYHTKGPNDHTAVFSNIVVDNKIGIAEQGKTGRNNSYRNNLVYDNGRVNWSLKNGLTHSGTVSAAPLLTALPIWGMPSLRPSTSSPAVGRATPEQAESTDFEGRPRDEQAGYDIGAYQH